LLRALRVIVNSFTFILLLLLACVVWRSSPLLSLLLALAAVDQFEDVYFYTYGRRLLPSWLMPLDLVFEVVAAGVGLGMLVFSLAYYAYFETWFFRALLLLSIPVIYSAVEDVAMWLRSPREASPVAPATAVMHRAWKEVCEEERFVRRKH